MSSHSILVDPSPKGFMCIYVCMYMGYWVFMNLYICLTYVCVLHATNNKIPKKCFLMQGP
ncbi:hypothetical protein HanRHA438_Chr00c51g0858781 [Helianthus annuus]|nr:hypothetical protein HanRHA438_Chr00c51g0858781 [Helianthus annuus]